MLDSKALTKIQSLALIAIIVVAAVAGSAAYILYFTNTQAAVEPIRIGVCADLDNTVGKGIWRAAVLAAEQVNAGGGVLGRNFTIVAEDDDSEGTPDVAVISNAITRLITVDKASYVITQGGSPEVFFAQEGICAQHNIIMFTTSSSLEEYPQRVLNNYDQYKYFFKLFAANTTALTANLLDDVTTVGKYSGLTKVALLFQDLTSFRTTLAVLNSSLPSRGFEVVYSNLAPGPTTDFTSYFSAVEESGAEIIVPFIASRATVSFVKEWHDRQSPCVVLGFLAAGGDPTFWDATEGKCEYISTMQPPFIAGYPFTNKSLATREAYLQRWGTSIPTGFATSAYDGIRFILFDAIKRAGTTETETVIKALETTDVETSLARHFVYTKSHDIMAGVAGSPNPPEEYQLIGLLQWQANKTLVPVVPETLMNEAGATYKFPPWDGPWNLKQTP